MKTLIRRSFLAFFLLLNVAHSKPEIINQNIIKQSAFDKISQITEELYSKTGVSIVAHFVEKVENGIPEYENNVTSNISRPYVFLIFVAKDEKVDMVISDELKSIVVKNDVSRFIGRMGCCPAPHGRRRGRRGDESVVDFPACRLPFRLVSD